VLSRIAFHIGGIDCFTILRKQDKSAAAVDAHYPAAGQTCADAKGRFHRSQNRESIRCSKRQLEIEIIQNE
jgi:hypothetical protein